MWLKFLLILFAGFGAGMVTGLIGASAVIAVASILIVFLDYNPYNAIGLGLAIDIVASIIVAIMYYRHKRVKIRPALIVLFFALIGVMIGSYFSAFLPAASLRKFTGLAILIIGIRLMTKKPVKKQKKKRPEEMDPLKILIAVFSGLIIGLIAGIFGAGGGIMIFLVLFFIYRYSPHTAVGTSVFFMIFIALFGAISHNMYSPINIWDFIVGSVGAIFGSIIFANITNKHLSEIQLQKLIGFVFSLLGVLMSVKEALIVFG